MVGSGREPLIGIIRQRRRGSKLAGLLRKTRQDRLPARLIATLPCIDRNQSESSYRVKNASKWQGPQPQRETSQKKPATPGFLLKQPALAVALWLYRFEFRGLCSCCDAFSVERPVCTICGHFKGEPVQKVRSRPPFDDRLSGGGPVGAEEKEPPRYKRGGHWVNLFLLIAGLVVTRPVVWLYRLNPEGVYRASGKLPTAQ